LLRVQLYTDFSGACEKDRQNPRAAPGHCIHRAPALFLRSGVSIAAVSEPRKPPIADFWPRAVAWIVDFVLFAALATFAYFAAGIVIALTLPGIGFIVYSAVLEGSSYGATLGKYAFGLRVTDLDRRPLGWQRATARALAKVVSAAVFPLGHVIVAFTDQKQTLHDLLASTLVVGRP
jgi:uncharacterized RDD family membrane protein YckC